MVARGPRAKGQHGSRACRKTEGQSSGEEKGGRIFCCRRLPMPQNMALNKTSSQRCIHDLDLDCVERILSLLGESPKDIAPAAAVCRQWRFVVEDIIWRDRCLQAAGGLCQELEYSNVNRPPGGWGGLYKLLVYCPGVYDHLKDDEKVRSIKGAFDDRRWWRYLGHVENRIYGFHMVTGDDVDLVLELQEMFETDVILISKLCDHSKNDCNRMRLVGARGIVKDFMSSEIARVSGVRRYIEGGADAPQPIRKALCPYCAGLLFQLRGDDGWGDLETRVCTKGHLLVASSGRIRYKVDNFPFLQEQVPNSGQGMRIERSGAVQFLCEHLPFAGDSNNLQMGVELVQRLDFDQVVQVAWRLSNAYSLLQLSYIDRVPPYYYTPAWSPIDFRSVRMIIQDLKVDGSKVLEAILTGQRDCLSEMALLIDVYKRRFTS